MDEKSRIDTDRGAVAAVDRMGVRVAAQPGVGLIESDAVTTGQHIGGGEASNAAADHGD